MNCHTIGNIEAVVQGAVRKPGLLDNTLTGRNLFYLAPLQSKAQCISSYTKLHKIIRTS